VHTKPCVHCHTIGMCTNWVSMMGCTSALLQGWRPSAWLVDDQQCRSPSPRACAAHAAASSGCLDCSPQSLPASWAAVPAEPSCAVSVLGFTEEGRTRPKSAAATRVAVPLGTQASEWSAQHQQSTCSHSGSAGHVTDHKVQTSRKRLELDC
jgi:hypothetical protein